MILAALAALPPAAAAAPSIGSKRAEAERVLAEIRGIDASLEHVIEGYNAATERLEAIAREQEVNRKRLKLARANYAHAQRNVSDRLVAIYTSGDATVLEVLLGASSIEDLLDRVDTVTRVSDQDLAIVGEAAAFRGEVRRREEKLAGARAEQERVVAERARRREEIERRLAERERLLASIRDEIAKLEAEEARKQRALAAQARQRLASRPVSQPASSGSAAAAAPVPAPIPVPQPAPPARYGGVVGIAMQYLGIPYKWGGKSPSTGFDCSGFIMYVYAKIGVSLPHNAAMQYGHGTPVSKSELEPGDLVFFNGLGHNGIYIGGGQFIHSPHTGDVVKISSLSDSWYAATWVGARRL